MEYRPDRLLFISFFLLGFFPILAWGQTTLCDIIDLNTCSGVTKQIRRSSSASLPSPASAANLNPANVSYDKGFGIEAIYQDHNSLNLNLATGTGRLGGALISQSLENSFFGNRVLELDDVILKRYKERKQYQSQKLSLALGGKLFRKKHAALDVGFLFKRHNSVKRINPGAGLSGRLGPLHFGASVYQDDFYIDLQGHNDPATGVPYSVFLGSDVISEKFIVQSYTAGTKIKNLALDFGYISSKYEFTDEVYLVRLYSAAFYYDRFLFNFAIRNEVNSANKIIDGELSDEKSQDEYFGGVQYSFGRHFIFGVNYNFFLLREISLSGSVFF